MTLNRAQMENFWFLAAIASGMLAGVFLLLAIYGVGVSVLVERSRSYVTPHEGEGLGVYQFTYVWGNFHHDRPFYGPALPVEVHWNRAHPSAPGSKWPPWPSYIYIGVPSYTPVLLFGGLTWWSWRRYKRKFPSPTERCIKCGYDLRAHHPGDKCPECGTPIPAPRVPPVTPTR